MAENTNLNVFKRFNKLLIELKMNPNEFGKALGYERSDKIYNITKGKFQPSFDILSDISKKFVDVNIDWLVSGQGEIFKTKTPINAVNTDDLENDLKNDLERKLQKTRSNPDFPLTQIVSDNIGSYSINRQFPLHSDRSIEQQQVPLYELEATAGLVGLFLDTSNQIPINYISIPDLPRCDGAVHIRGDSMYPLLKSGDIVLYKQVVDFRYMVWGEMYLVSYSIDGDEYVAVKFINKIEGDKESILLVSHNQHHAPAEIPIASIRALALIKASIRYNTMG